GDDDVPEGTGLILNVAVVPGARRLGLGRALVAKALEGFAARGAFAAELDATAENVGAVRMYARLGFAVKSVDYRICQLRGPARPPKNA
ncbi:MAG: GNAT family N-acetyltransferase, partial [Thermoguttaceae bacterium]|nr:GNAT family N-acetyltransferase [Thermoguttaceae bacterium]